MSSCKNINWKDSALATRSVQNYWTFSGNGGENSFHQPDINITYIDTLFIYIIISMIYIIYFFTLTNQIFYQCMLWLWEYLNYNTLRCNKNDCIMGTILSHTVCYTPLFITNLKIFIALLLICKYSNRQYSYIHVLIISMMCYTYLVK